MPEETPPERLSWHVEQFDEPKRSTVHLEAFASRIVGDATITNAVELGSGSGANMRHLAHLAPDAMWTGVDLDPKCIAAGTEHLDPARFKLLQGDLLDLDFPADAFDLTFSIMTLSWLEDYARPLEEMLRVSRGWVFVTSLFHDGELDAYTRVRGLRPGRHEGYDEHYNVYSLPRFEDACRALGATEFVAQPFEVDIDLPGPSHGGMGTRTMQTIDGARLQFSGPLWMPWWFIAVR